ncbi:dTMP kinase [Geothrix sp. 21YS21S-4]|uniref:dTMP kinase n=1 Tax=Geothrix sp. 21YS21S-4 TaxID=3068889 RepID=UPI0027B9888E|nr:dTMP kinase [Geothrix sp. 21YS21S-4]
MFITIEGVEGSGKSTQLLRLSERLRRLGLPLVVSKEPGGTPLGRELRRLLLEPHASGDAWCPDSELLLFYADRAQHLYAVIRPALAAKQVVLVDRFEDSSRAYQGASGVPDASLDRLSDLVLKGLRPDLTVILDVDPEVSLQRVEVRNLSLGTEFAETRFDHAALAFHRQVRERFLQIARSHPDRVALVPARDPVEQVEAAIWARVAPKLRHAGFEVS